MKIRKHIENDQCFRSFEIVTGFIATVGSAVNRATCIANKFGADTDCDWMLLRYCKCYCDRTVVY